MDLNDIFKGNTEAQTQATLKTQTNPSLEEIIRLLYQTGKMPKVNPTVLPYGENGNFNHNQNTINFDVMYGNNPNTMTHEFSHALDKTMFDFVTDPSMTQFDTPASKRNFAVAYNKLNPATTKLPLGMPDSYRHSPNELRSFGVGNYANGGYKSDYKIAPHVDATMATEAAILRDLFARTLRKK